MSYTPGPLDVSGPSLGLDKSIDDGGDYCILKDGRIIGEAFRNIYYTKKADPEANAMLWAAAPDLLEACKAFLSWIRSGARCFPDEGQLEQAVTSAKAAIAKAEGNL